MSGETTESDAVCPREQWETQMNSKTKTLLIFMNYISTSKIGVKLRAIHTMSGNLNFQGIFNVFQTQLRSTAPVIFCVLCCILIWANTCATTPLAKGLLFGTYLEHKLVLQVPESSTPVLHTEAEAFFEVNKLQVGNYKDFVVVKDSTGYASYELQVLGRNKTLRSQKDLLSVIPLDRIDGSTHTKVVAVVAANGDARFFESPKANVSIPPAVQTVDEVLNQLSTLQQVFGTEQKQMGLFPSIYRITTEAAQERIEVYRRNGLTQEAQFIEELVVDFGNRYFTSLYQYCNDGLDEVPEIWRTAFDIGRMADYLKPNETLNTLSLSIIAHVVYDLSLSLRAVQYKSDDRSQRQAFLEFDRLLLDQKENILSSIAEYYSYKQVNHLVEAIDRVDPFWIDRLFIIGRKKASRQSQQGDHRSIEDFSLKVARRTNMLIRLFY